MRRNIPGLYRIRQFMWAAAAWVRPDGTAGPAVRPYLPPAAIHLFEAMPAYDRRHALKVMRGLRQQGHADPDLLAAALLHDVGKTAYPSGRLRLGHRVAVVLLNALSPGALERLGRRQPGRWLLPFYVQQHHASIGAELAQQAGCTPAMVELIRRHEGAPAVRVGAASVLQPGDSLLAALQAVDSQN